MSYLKQRTNSKKSQFVRAQSMATDTGETCFVIYDTSEKSFYAQTELTDSAFEQLIAEVHPKPKVQYRLTIQPGPIGFNMRSAFAQLYDKRKDAEKALRDYKKKYKRATGFIDRLSTLIEKI